MTQEQNNSVKQAVQYVEFVELLALRLAVDDCFDNIRLDLYDLLKSLHKTKHALEELPQTSQ